MAECQFLIFDSTDAANHYVKGIAELTSEDKKAQDRLHALIAFDRDTQKVHVKIIPFGIWHTSSSELTEINLPAVGSLHCAIELKDRCLLAFRLSSISLERSKGKHRGWCFSPRQSLQ
jgi:hypothetical protein